jgi:hypothetical protein
MPDAYVSGLTGSVKIGATSFSFDRWKLTIKTVLVEVTNFTSGGFQQFVTAITGATLTVSGPYNTGNMAFVCGVAYIWILGFTALIALTVTAIIETLEPDVDAKGRASVSITAQSHGAFTAAIA